MPKHILLIEDDSLLSEMYSMVLKDEGLEVTILKDGKSALVAALVAVDLVLLDIRIPDIDGFDILKDYRRRGFTGPIIVLSNSPQANKELAQSLGATDFFLKSHTDISDVLVTIEKYLD